MTGTDPRNPATDPLQALRDELAGVGPAPEFAARVRRDLESAGGVPAPYWTMPRRWLVPTVAAAALIAGVVATWQPAAPAPEVQTARRPSEMPAPALAPPKPAITREGEHPSARAENVRTANPWRVGSGQRERPDLVVITNQPAVLRALWARARGREGSALVEVPAVPAPDGAAEIVVAPIEVNPIVVPWLVDPPAAPGSLPIIR